MRVLMGFVFLLITLTGACTGGYIGFLLIHTPWSVFWCAVGGLIIVGLPCSGFYSHMFPAQKCPSCGHDLSKGNDE